MEKGTKGKDREGARLRLAVCGIRGIPACYGGFETFAEEMSVRLAERGHEVVVYGRRHVIDYEEESYRGVGIKLLWAPRHKYLETPVHTLLCLLHLLRNRVDVILVCNAANSPLIWIARLFRMPVAVNVDGIERKRAKWNAVGRMWYRLGELCSVLFANRLISDAEVIRRYYLERYRRNSVVIRYGSQQLSEQLVAAKLTGEKAPDLDSVATEFYQGLNLSPGRYLLYVSRLEPENNAHIVVEAYNLLPASCRKMPLVIVGDAPYAKDYITRLKEAAGENIYFLGYRFGESYRRLQEGAYCYVQATEVGGTHPALVEAMGFGNCVLANDTPENREVLGDAGLYYQRNDSKSLMLEFRRVIENRDLVKQLRAAAWNRARDLYDWEKITSSYEELFSDLAGSKAKREAASSAHVC